SNDEITPVPLKHDWGMSQGFEVLGNDIIVSLANGTTHQLAYFTKNKKNWKKSKVNAGDMDEHLSVSLISEKEDKIAFIYSTASIPNQYRVSPVSFNKAGIVIEKGVEFASVNKHLKKKTFAKTESKKWIGALGEEVTGMLYYPANYEEGKKYPLMVAIHGGPTGVDMEKWSDRWSYYHNLLTQRGMFILKPNYHGSSNHGQKFMESIKGHYYEYELPDILSGIDMLEKEGKIYRDSMAVMGWSNGAILATMLTVKYPDMFLAAGAGAGDVNWTSDFGTCEFGVTFDQSYFGGAPWDDVNGKFYNENYIIKSPLFEMDKVKTPTIIFHGSEDRAVPRDQGWEYYRALQQIGQAPVRFLWFPDQPHSLGKLTHQTRKIKEELAWFDHYFLGRYKPENEAVKEESPLMALLELEKVQKHRGVLGIMDNKILLPEVVALGADSISVGRFEVTNAQYQNFKPDHTFSMSHANYPVTGMGLENALAYVKWLSETTGKNYRLPNGAEAKAWHEKARKIAKEENTLNYWAGYEITIDEVADLMKKVDSVSGTLLREGGMFKPTEIGKAKLYDLGGNAAEYFQENGKSGTYGYSAYDFVDEGNEKVKSPDKGIGFRVVLEE
ncbi:MAG: prolyl oligopeptidase family serine peptidase, partial [Bacteroidetes bacterium]|nr:prolyl oligopeptidase family serine peptidase [Bacteroidota bacterium]